MLDAARSPAPDPGDDPVAALFRRAGGPAFRLAHALLGERGAAEDVVQEAFVRVLARRDALADPEALDGYVTRAVRNLAYNHLRRRKTAGVAQERLERAADPAAAPADPALDEEAARAAAALAALPPEQREVVHLRVHEGLEFKTIAARTGVPLGTVHSRYRYALARLRQRLAAGEAGGRHDG